MPNHDSHSRRGHWLLPPLGLLIALVGLVLAAGGGWLITLGGSWYYLFAGLAMLVSGVQLIRARSSGFWWYVLVFIGTLSWTIWESGSDYWRWVPRMGLVTAFGFFVALLAPHLRRPVSKTLSRLSAVSLAAIFVAAFALAFKPYYVTAATGPGPQATNASTVSSLTPQADGDWAAYGRGYDATRYSPLKQINRDNVATLARAWEFRTGDLPGQRWGAETTPLKIGDIVYLCTARNQLIALQATTGRQLWRYDPKVKDESIPYTAACRGVAYYETPVPPLPDKPPSLASINPGPPPPPAAPPDPACETRIIEGTLDGRLVAVDARNGKPCVGFGDNGQVDITAGMGDTYPGMVSITSPPTIVRGVVVTGHQVLDGQYRYAPSGVIQGYDAVTGQLRWAWDLANPAINGLPPEGQTYTRGTPNVWSAMSYDAKLGLVYLPTGNATPDFFAGTRTELDDKYSSSIVALDVKNGQVRWHFQTTHHDLWDFDLPAQPLLYDIPDDKGGVQPALAQVTKQGEIFVINRETGVPIAKVEEKPVPQGNVPGERYSPTQPFSVEMPSIGNQTLKESDMWGATPFDQLLCRISFKGMRHEGVYTPPGLDPALQFPGSLGGMNWGSVSVDPTSNYMFVNDMRLGLANYMIPRADIPKGASGIEMGVVPQDGTPYGAMRQRFLSAAGIPCQRPPFGTMSAIDLKTRKLMWQVPVGTVQDTGPLGIRMHLPIPIGMPTLGASLSTQSGLLFFAGTQDFYLRAFDSGNGNEIWKARLPVGSQSGPMTYVSPKTGKQYILISAGGARQSPDRGDYVIAYALP